LRIAECGSRDPLNPHNPIAESATRNPQSAIRCRVHPLATALGLSLLGSCGGLLVASSLVMFPQRVRTRLIPWLVSFAVGALLGVALLALLPEALAELAPPAVFSTLLAGILVFFVLEKLVLLRHCHTDDCHVHGAAAPLVFLGDAFHNFLDGAIICTAVMTSVPLGVNTAIAVAAHEIPQEVGDVAVLLAAGYSRSRALLLNVVTGASGILGAILAFAAVEIVPGVRPYVLAISAASLLYIAMSDLIPDLHRGEIDANGLRQVLLIAAGIGTVVLFERVIG
jgi:zinc and cadmium transporter